jgi:hypothetical protein
MEEAEVPLERLREQVKETAEHSGATWISVAGPEHSHSGGIGRNRRIAFRRTH